MHDFCPQCDNLLYPQTQPTFVLLVCRCCGYFREAREARLLCTTSFTDEAAYAKDQLAILAKHLPHDPTLPRVNNILCPAKCKGPTETIVYEYDSKELRFVYVCVTCGHAWLSGS